MEAITHLLVAGVTGGLVFAILFLAFRRTHAGVSGPIPRVPSSSDVIDISRIHVAGIGGLGLIATAIIVAIFLPQVRGPLAIGAILGLLLGVGLILRRA